MWRSNLISRSVLFASILLSNAFAIFFIATCSVVSEFKAELTNKQTNNNTKSIKAPIHSLKPPFSHTQNQPLNKQQLQFIHKQKLKTLSSSQTQFLHKESNFPSNTPKKHDFYKQKKWISTLKPNKNINEETMWVFFQEKDSYQTMP
jgi:hypothetical protein